MHLASRILAPAADRPRALLACGALVAGACLAYSYALGNPFVYDDHRLILENRSLERLLDWRALLWHDVARPLVNLTFALDYAIWGGRTPAGFHLTNLLLHCVGIVAVFWMTRALVADAGRGVAAVPHAPLAPAVIAGGLFALHPALTQAVAYVSARAEVLCAVFLLTAFAAARRWFIGGSRWWALPTLLAWLAALASKEIAAVFPLALLLYDLVFFGRTSRLTRVHLPLLALAAAAGLVRLVVLTTAEGATGWSVNGRFALVELDVFRQYVQLLLWPAGQTVFHAVAPVHGLTDPRAVAGAMVLMAVAWSAWTLRRISPVATVGLAWFVLLLLPSAILVVLDRGEPMAEHRLYAASAGAFMAAGALLSLAVERLAGLRPRAVRLVWAGAIVVAAILTAQTMTRTIVWRRPVSLWLEAAEYAPDHWLPRLALGEALHEDGRHAEAVRMFEAAAALRPSELMAYAKLGQCQLDIGDIPAAQDTFTRLRALDPTSPAAATGLGLVALRARDTRLARQYFLETLRQVPQAVPVEPLSELAALSDGDPRELLQWCEAVQQLAPATPGAADCVARHRAELNAR